MINGIHTEHVYRVFDVFKFPRHQGWGDGVYGIVCEKLEKFPIGKITHSWNALKALRNIAEEATHPLTWEEVEAEARLDGVDLAPLRDLGLPDVVDELEWLGIKFFDYHHGNLMVRPGTKGLVAIDLGFSDTGGADPPVLESRSLV